MQAQLIEAIDDLIRDILKENPDTVRDRSGSTVITCSDGPAVAFRVMKTNGHGHDAEDHVVVIYNDKRSEGSCAWHAGIRMPSPPGSYEVLRGRLWPDERILSFYENENMVDGYRADIEKFFDDIGEDIDKYNVEYGDSAQIRGFVKWKRSSKAYKAPKMEIPPEIRKKIDHILPQFHLAVPGPAKDKLKAELDALYKQAGVENEKEAQKKAYFKAAGAKRVPFEKGGGGSYAGYAGRLPAIAEEKVRLYNKTLDPSLWDENKHLNPEVRNMLLQVAFDFYNDTDLKMKVQDVQLLGSTANYNWTPESDMDVHILVDGTQLGLEKDQMEKFFRALSGKWNLEHEVKIKGHRVEIYIQCIYEKNAATAVYSLTRDAWIKVPEVEKISVDKDQIQKKYSMWVERINAAIKKGDDVSLKKILESLRDARQAGLKAQGEFSTENLVFKILRARGFIEKLKDAYNNLYDKKMSVNDVLDPTSQGPNPDAGLDGGDNGSFYRSMNSKMRQMEAITQSSLKSRMPQMSVDRRDPKLEKMTLENLKALREKAKRFYNAAVAAEDQEEVERSVEFYLIINDEIKRRLEYINKPVTEDRDDQIWLGWVDPSNHRVIGVSGEEASMHDHLFDTHPETQQLDWEDAPKWRFRKDLNTVYWWGQIPDEDIKESLDIWLKRNLHVSQPRHVRLRAVSWSQDDKDNVHRSHGTMEEGYGAGNMETDRLNIHNPDGSVRKWQIRSKDAPKTPKMTKEVMDMVNEVLDQTFLVESPTHETLKKNKKPLTDEERAEVMKRGAVWHHGPNGEETPAVWKSVVKGKTWYACNTHRAIQVKPTLKGAIKAFEFIKTTA